MRITLDTNQTQRLRELLTRAHADASIVIEHSPGANYRVSVITPPPHPDASYHREAFIITTSGTVFETEWRA